jgi:hypothetical protein
MLMVAGHAMTALPSAVANNSTTSTALLDLGALGTAACALILSYCASLAFRRPWGADRSELDRLGRTAAPRARTADEARTPIAA